MQNRAVIWTSLLACLAVIGVAGVRLSRYGDIIAEKSGMGRGWVGLILLATVTSLPELVTGLSAVTVANVPDIAVGDIMGSCVFNLLIIVVLDFLYRKESVYARARQGNVLSAGYGYSDKQRSHEALLPGHHSGQIPGDKRQPDSGRHHRNCGHDIALHGLLQAGVRIKLDAVFHVLADLRLLVTVERTHGQQMEHGPLLADAALSHASSAFSAMMMSGLAVVGLVLRPASRVLRTVSWISLLLLVIYLLNTLFLYLYGH